jgi:EpsI family protein
MHKLISPQFLLTAGLLAGALSLGGLAARRIPEALVVPLDQITSQVSGWTARGDHKLDPSTLKSLDPTAYLSRTYQKGATDLDLFIAFYAQQRAGESMHSPKHCLPGAGWEIWQLGSAWIPVNGRQIEVNKYSIQNSGTRMVMYYWYQSKSRIITNEYLGKLLLAKDTVLTGRTAGSIVRLMLPDTPDARQDGVAFASKLIPEVQRCFGN